MTALTKQAAIVQEVREALRNGPLSTAQMVEHCETAEDGKVLSRVIYDLRNTGMVAIDPEPGAPGRDGRQAKRYRWIGPMDATPPPAAHRKVKPAPVPAPAPVTTSLATQPAPVTTKAPEATIPMPPADRIDQTEYALADLVDQADETLLALADSLLNDNPLWARLRRLADETHGALCDYRLMRSLEVSNA